MTKAELYIILNRATGLKKQYIVRFFELYLRDWNYSEIIKGIKVEYIVPTTGELKSNATMSSQNLCYILGLLII